MVIPDNYRDMKFEGVRTRKFDEMGLPLDDGYDYSQHIYQGGGRTIYSITEPAEKLNAGNNVDIDVEIDKIDPENKELLDCLDADDEAGY